MNLKDYEFNEEFQKHFILGFYIDENLCDEIVQSFKLLHDEKKTTYREPPRDYHVVDLLKHMDKKYGKEYLIYLSNIIKKYKDVFKHCSSPLGIYNEINVQYFQSNHNYSVMHSERSSVEGGQFRNLFFITYLNDVHQNGETEFFYQEIKIKPKKGLTIISPAEWTHTHRGNATDEEKYIVTGWTEFKVEYNDPLIYVDNILNENSNSVFKYS